jgi:methionine transaminase
MKREISFQSKLPDVGTTIFTVISAEAEKHGAINLAQGFPNFDCDPRLKELVNKHMMDAKNQYAPMPGVLSLREGIANKIFETQNIVVDPVNEITITAGATQALFTAIATFISFGDEVIIIEPAYDSYAPAIRTVGGTPVYLTTFAPNFELDFDELQSLITDKTKMIIVNTPGNPSTKLLSKEEIDLLANILEGTDIIVLSDEVYEHLVFDNKKHQMLFANESLRNRTIAVYSFGKTFHVTGWKIGYILACKNLMSEFRKVHQYNVFCVNSVGQYGLSEYLQNHEACKILPSFYQEKRDLLSTSMKESAYSEVESEGSFFTLFDYSNLSQENDQKFVRKLIEENKIASIPLSSFYHRPIENQYYIRLCFAKDEQTLLEGARRLKS